MIKRVYFVSGQVRSGLEFGAAHSEFWRLVGVTSFLPKSADEIINHAIEMAASDSPHGHTGIVTITAFNKVSWW